MPAMNASSIRDTQFEISATALGGDGNSFQLRASERGVSGSHLELSVTDDDINVVPGRMDRIHDGLRALEEVLAEVFARKAGEHDPKAVHDLIRRGEIAKIETAKAEAEAVVRNAELDAEIEAKQALIAALDAAAAIREVEAIARMTELEPQKV